MTSRRRLLAALDGFVRKRDSGVRSKQHVAPLLEFVAAEVRARGVRSSSIAFEVALGQYYSRTVDFIVSQNGTIELAVLIITQSGSVRKNLNNRRRDIVGDALNLRTTCPQARVGLIYLIRADEEARRRGVMGSSPIEELAAFLRLTRIVTPPLDMPLLDAVALIAADQEDSGRIRIESGPEDLDILGLFFDTLVRGPNDGSN